MPTFTMTKNYDDGSILTESQLDDIKNSIETFLNTTKIDSDNIQAGGIATANYAAGSVDSTALAASAVTTAKINDGAVTQAKRAALGQQTSSSSSTFTTTSTSYVDVTNLSVSLTTTGRMVCVTLIPDGNALSNVGVLTSSASSATVSSAYKCVRDSTDVGEMQFGAVHSGSASLSNTVPCSAVCFYDTPSAGTYTYKLQAKSTSGTTTSVLYSKLLAYEL